VSQLISQESLEIAENGGKDSDVMVKRQSIASLYFKQGGGIRREAFIIAFSTSRQSASDGPLRDPTANSCQLSQQRVAMTERGRVEEYVLFS